ncbi:uncharacterized protein LOC121799277 [Salvia splendens]|uniref:uncharacterized protein LOC121799277 n=1 Tax=Salvia splendens TaxID=180675 RepID=UPI001C277610|nr:uncharacterized protein LOC121799277 [Salvia splendens]
MGGLPVGGGVAEMASHSPPFAEPNRLEIGAENWAVAERAAAEIIGKAQPTPVSEERRKEVVDYIQRLFRDCVGAEVFPYGSVPLKTYLPDGDIDLTAFGGAHVEDTLADKMRSVLKEQEANTDAEFVVKDVQLIRAEVKLVKCIVQDIVVDISVNQIGGLCTLCFLEQVDRLIGRDHLFKRSIILIKAWCYYESRILGAHHGLISTYALETLVLYIFNLYHSALEGPLAVLYKFLDCFSKFDWDTGVVRLSSLPDFVVEIPEDSDKHLLLSNDFLNNCIRMFSVPSRVGDKTPLVFPKKHLNIVDPLKDLNNLGRSVSKGNLYRIRSAFSYAARKLARILLQPQDSIANELTKFFANTMARHGGGQRPDIQDFDKLLISNRAVSVVPYQGICRTDNFDEYIEAYAVSTAAWQPSSGKMSEDFPQGIQKTLDIDLGSQTPRAEESVNGIIDSYKLDVGKNASLSAFSGTGEGGVSTVGSREENMSVDNCNTVFSAELRDSNHVVTDQCRASMSGLAESLNSMDLTGDYDCCIRHLQYGRWCYENGLGVHPLPVHPLPRPTYPWEGFPVLHYNQNSFSHHHSGFHHSPVIYGIQPVLLPAVPFPWEDVPKHRGTGTYLPYMNTSPHGNRFPVQKESIQAPSGSTRHHNWRNMSFPEPNMLDRSSHELSQPVDKAVASGGSSSDNFPPHQYGHPSANGSLIYREGTEVELVGHPPGSENSWPQRTVSSSPRTPSGAHKAVASGASSSDSYPLHQYGHPNANGSLIHREGTEVEFVGHPPGSENSWLQRAVSSSPRTLSGAHKTQTALSSEQDRIASRSSYRLKDEDDFPPLSN